MAGRAGPDIAEAATQDPRQFEPNFLAQTANLAMGFVDHVAAGFGVLAFS